MKKIIFCMCMIISYFSFSFFMMAEKEDRVEVGETIRTTEEKEVDIENLKDIIPSFEKSDFDREMIPNKIFPGGFITITAIKIVPNSSKKIVRISYDGNILAIRSHEVRGAIFTLPLGEYIEMKKKYEQKKKDVEESKSKKKG